MGSSYTDKVIISVGGSLIVQNGGINTEFLKKLNTFVREQLAKNKNRQFFLVTGGGTIARQYRDAGEEVIGRKITRDDKDWLGIHATKMNAHLVRTIFRDIAHPFVLKHYEIIRKVEEPVVVASGWKPGWSTDYCAVMVCEDYGIKEMINLSNISQVFDKDPKQFPDAKPLKNISWEDFRKLVGDEWIPGMNSPFDPVAARKAHELGVKVIVLDGNDFENIEKYFRGEQFVGTVIE
ncbi:MAG: aspartate kinase [Candidatus Levybacteria bacterium RIFOXYA1_FULL_41_10]|nr:MAG: Aspartate/glutamate/uridylate kinase [Candidatus Levybacteria bacterium GW2011_GWA1_39_32]KKR50980.1 MAG: Aspartate/glutamate/uridylate kinase [Candidatus Levybacteria bacterium GW2011_GWC1_40_19]KKR72842.1 MAG: Aspartate/glutamate/uridylate kinase [Candidatus Levybacteria bacterium GW2011_GWC2_40_7]KKR95125.1 MAG: Aspartate/glutamate/uridylate kinase [Candidatus Levybacteria bacterium GW2011_GWA2_41_15]KKS01134.1 MAG: Aspartate/glutamate/uridylate kinase [Candidatus Levybacteria bacter